MLSLAGDENSQILRRVSNRQTPTAWAKRGALEERRNSLLHLAKTYLAAVQFSCNIGGFHCTSCAISLVG